MVKCDTSVDFFFILKNKRRYKTTRYEYFLGIWVSLNSLFDYILGNM